MSDQEPVEQGDISFNFNITKLWHMISVRAPASPHDPVQCAHREVAPKASTTPYLSRTFGTSALRAMPRLHGHPERFAVQANGESLVSGFTKPQGEPNCALFVFPHNGDGPSFSFQDVKMLTSLHLEMGGG